MNCKKAQKYLQDYIEGELDQETAQEVSQHLQSCSRCTEELEYLKQHLSLMKGLETVRAPEDFLERVHKKIDRSPEERKLFHILFRPMRFKIPLEFSAVAAMVIAVIFVLQVTRPMKHKEPVTVEKEINITRALPYEKREEVKAEKLEHVQKEKPSEYPASESTLQAKKTKPAEKTIQSISQKKELQPSEGTTASKESLADKTAVSLEKTPAAEKKAELKAGSAEAIQERSKPGVLQPAPELTVVMVLPGGMENEEETMKTTSTVASTPAEYDRVLSSTPAEEAEKEKETSRPEQAEKSPVQEKTEMVSKTRGEESTGIRAALRKAEKTGNPALETAAVHVIDLVQSEGGMLVAKNFPKTPDQPFVVTADIPGPNINDFLDQLGGYGNVRIPPFGEAEKKALTVRIRIEIRLPAQ